MAINDYLKKIDKAYSAGNATEHTYRPALKELLESMLPGVTATNEPKQQECGAPDYIITRNGVPLGYIEAKDIGKSLNDVEKTDQMKRYLDGLNDLILTDYLEFRWYVKGEPRLKARLGDVEKKKIKPDSEAFGKVSELLNQFLSTAITTVNSSVDLADRMARIGRLIRSSIQKTLDAEKKSTHRPLHNQLDAFKKQLIRGLKDEDFADMYAQTICYGMFAARCNDLGRATHFERRDAAGKLPKTNPFLRQIFNKIAGIDIEEGIEWAVDDLAELLDKTDMEAILSDFGRRSGRQNPLFHFYESFLSAYDAKMRAARGVYYTPEAVVSYIIHSIDHILKKDFNLADGLADASRIEGDSSLPHRVQILDPATGTGTFIYEVVSHIHESFADNKGLWPGYVHNDLLPRIYGFELLMAPYTVAHLKLGMFLHDTGYDLQSSQLERLKVYLTNTLEEVFELSGTDGFNDWIATEANAAGAVKKNTPIMVVMGNPPYSVTSMNAGFNMEVKEYYYPHDSIKEANPKVLLDDYVKFILFSQIRIEKTGDGVLAFICNHGYLDNPTFRRMRQSLMETFDDIYILDLHGNSKRKEKAPDGGKDENVFDIQQGVAIGVFVKKKKSDGKKSVRHAGLYGRRDGKYEYLAANSVVTTDWTELTPQAPFYLLVPQDRELLPEYEQGWKVTEIMPLTSTGVKTHRDHFVFDFDKKALQDRIEAFRDLSISDADIGQDYHLKDTGDWKLSNSRKLLANQAGFESAFTKCLYRPFDIREYFHHDIVVDRPRTEVMRHMLAGKNLSLITTRQVTSIDLSHVLCSRCLVEMKTCSHDRGTNFFPLYLYPDPDEKGKQQEIDIKTKKTANLSPKFIAECASKLNMVYIPAGKGDQETTFGPEDIFNYMYAVFHSPTYRSRYAEFLKMDFPRLPLTSKPSLFRLLCEKGGELVGLHLLEKKAPAIINYPAEGDDSVSDIRYEEPKEGGKGRVWINKKQYFEGVAPEVWEFHIGGYQVCHKWLKDRKGRILSYEEQKHYPQVIAAITETILLMGEIDDLIDEHGGWPLE